MYKKLLGAFVFMFLMAIAVPVLAQRYDSCAHRGHGRGHHKNYRNYDRDDDRRYSRRNYDRGRGDRNRNAYYGGRRNRGYAPVYYAPSYPSYYVVRRAPGRRYYRPAYRQPYYGGRRGGRGSINVRIGF